MSAEPIGAAVVAPDEKTLRRQVLAGMRAGRPRTGPLTVHFDVVNACNAACVTCWDHSPLLATPRPAEWRRRRMSFGRFRTLVDELRSIGSLRSVILSGMGEPLLHPHIYDMLALVKACGWEVTVLTNLVAADIEQLERSGVDQLLVGVHGVTPDSYSAFHPGWTEDHFATLCRALRRMNRAGIRCRHVQVVNRDNASELVDMVRFGKLFGAQRVSYKLASLGGGTEACAITPEQRGWLEVEGIPAARDLAVRIGVATNLDLFARQVAAAASDHEATTSIRDVGCFMGYVYTRITADLEVLYCCDAETEVGSLRDGGTLSELWRGSRWQAMRDRIRAGRWFSGCDRCGKLEQNVKWSTRYREGYGEAAWLEATGQDRHGHTHTDARPDGSEAGSR